MTYFLLIMDGICCSDEHMTVIEALETSGFRNVNYKLNAKHIVTFVGDEFGLPECLKQLDVGMTMVVEAHQEEIDGNDRMKYTRLNGGWMAEPFLPLFPANQVLDFI